TPSTGSWKSAGKTPVNIVDSNGEIGPVILRPNGQVFAAGATGSNAIYNTAIGKWSAGPRFPKVNGKQLDVADGPAATLPDGDAARRRRSHLREPRRVQAPDACFRLQRHEADRGAQSAERRHRR